MAKDESLEDIDDEAPDAGSRLRRLAEKRDTEAKTATERLSVLERENAALKAGVDVSTRRGQAWLSTYDGPLDDVEAMRADAQDFDPTLTAGPTATAQPLEQGQGQAAAAAEGEGQTVEPTGHAERQALADGAEPADAATGDLRKEALARSREAMRTGATYEEAAGSFVAEVARATHEGRLAPLEAPAGQRV
jgi:hypothetical protein